MKRFRACMSTVVESKLTLLQGACSAEAAGYRSYLLELLFLARPIRCEATVSFVGVVQRRQAKQERHRALRRSSWTLRPDAVIHFSASGECVLVSPRLKATVRVHSPSVDGLRPSLRRGRLVALSVHNVLHDGYLAFFFASCGVKRARPFVPASGPPAAAALPACPALQRQQGGCNGRGRGWR